MIAIILATTLFAADPLPKEVNDVFRDADCLVIYSLAKDADADKNTFYGRRMVKKKVVKNAAKSKVLDSLDAAIKASNNVASRSFEKYGHCLRAEHNGTVVDLVISFPERKGIVFIDGKMQKKDVRLTDKLESVLDDALNK